MSRMNPLSRRRFLEVAATAAVGAAMAPLPSGNARAAGAASWAGPSGLLTSLLPQGLGVATGRARFSWQVEKFGAGTVQTHHQLQVATSPSALEGGGPYVWDSGKVASAESVAVAYAGPELHSATAYWWRVRAFNGSAASTWSRSTLLSTDIGAAWTGVPIWTPAQTAPTDGVLRARVKITAVAATLWFRAASANVNYMWQFRAGTPGVLKTHVCVNGTYTVLATKNLAVPLAVGTWYDLAIKLTGSTFVTSIDGTVVDTTVDTRYTSGTIGVRNGSTESNTWDSISFTAADGTVIISDDFSSDRGTFPGLTVSGGTLIAGKGQSSLADGGPDDDWALLRHEFTLSTKKIAAAVLYITAQSPAPIRQYPAKIWCNGQLVGFAAQRGSADAARYHCYDVTARLREGGKNVLAALAYTTDDKRFLAELRLAYSDGTAAVVAATGSSWKSRRQDGLLRSAGTIGSSFYNGQQEYWDMRREPVGWTAPGFDASGWAGALVKTPLTGLVPALVEPVSLHDVAPAKVTEVVDGTWIVDLGKEIAGGLRLTVNGTGGQTVEVRLGEELNADGTVKYALRAGVTYREIWTLRDGAQTIEHWGYRGFRYAQLICSDKTLDLSAAVTGRAWRAAWNDADASFSSSSPDLDRVYELCRYSIEATRGDLYTDTPTRERGPYEGDALINQRSEYAVQRSYALARSSDGYLTRKRTWPTEYRLMNVMSAWEDYLHTGDPSALEADYDLLAAQHLTRFLGSDGLVHKDPGAASTDLGDLVDWPVTNRDGYVFTTVNTVVNAFQYAAYDAMAKIAAVAGRTGDVTTWRQRADTLAAKMRSTLLDAANGRFVDGAGTTHSAQHATAFPVALGVTAPGTVPDKVLTALGATLAAGGMKMSVYGAQFLLDALFACGRADAAIALMTDDGTSSWLHMLDDLGATIVTEAWDPSLKSNMTFSHAWGSAPANVIPRQILGVKVTAPGAAELEIRPRPGTLTAVQGRVPTIRGVVEVSLDRAGGYRLDVDIPANTTAFVTIELGKTAPASCTISGDHPDAHRRTATDMTGPLLIIGPVGSGRTTITSPRL